ncbi:MAG: SAM-dependent methyltransferase [Deltaproteobacteria bacterium]|nr:SAM-dependent methyltransferase [Deltaproteobacteria bacterium]
MIDIYRRYINLFKKATQVYRVVFYCLSQIEIMRDNKPSRTALKVALVVVTLGAKPEMINVLPPGIVQASQELLLASGAVGFKTIRWAGSKRAVSIYEAFDWMLPGQFEGFAHRKVFFERQAREGIGAGATQVLVLGAGYDTLGWRLAPEFSEVSFFEIDHPATACLKSKGISSMGKRKNLYLIAEDLGKNRMVDVLEDNVSWSQNALTVILAEGLLMYLHPEAVSNLFHQCAEMVSEGSRFIFSYIPAGEDGRLDAGRWTRLMLWLQKVVGEPWTWSVQPEELGSFLKNVGWEHSPELEGTSGMHGVEFYAVATK